MFSFPLRPKIFHDTTQAHLLYTLNKKISCWLAWFYRAESHFSDELVRQKQIKRGIGKFEYIMPYIYSNQTDIVF